MVDITKLPGSMKTSDDLTMEYAANRIRFREIKEEISNLAYPCDENGIYTKPAGNDKCVMERMQEFFKEWCDGGDDGYGHEPWPEGGWVEALEDAEIDDPDMLALAKLWQHKKSIIREAGMIRRAIAARGRKLLHRQTEHAQNKREKP